MSLKLLTFSLLLFTVSCTASDLITTFPNIPPVYLMHKESLCWIHIEDNTGPSLAVRQVTTKKETNHSVFLKINSSTCQLESGLYNQLNADGTHRAYDEEGVTSLFHHINASIEKLKSSLKENPAAKKIYINNQSYTLCDQQNGIRYVQQSRDSKPEALAHILLENSSISFHNITIPTIIIPIKTGPWWLCKGRKKTTQDPQAGVNTFLIKRERATYTNLHASSAPKTPDAH